MAENIYLRVCYENGNKKNKKIFEYHGFCDCDGCRWRYQYLQQPRNTVTVTLTDSGKTDEAKEFVKKWKCQDGEHSLKTEYINFDNKMTILYRRLIV